LLKHTCPNWFFGLDWDRESPPFDLDERKARSLTTFNVVVVALKGVGALRTRR
jgi:hypothetical protein